MKINCCFNRIENKNREKRAYGLTDYIINHLPEIHLPGYNFAGPGTRLTERLKRGDRGVNGLDEACRLHDIDYTNCGNFKDRRNADRALIARAFKRIYSKDSKLGERAAAVLVSGLMGAKIGLSKIGLGLGNTTEKRSQKRKIMRKSHRESKNHKKVKRGKRMPKKQAIKKNRKSITFSKMVAGIRSSIKKLKPSSSVYDTVRAAIRSANDMKRNRHVKMTSRALKLPKFGGNLLSIVPILSGLSAIGSISASAGSVVRAIQEIRKAEKELTHRKVTGDVKIGRGLNLIFNSKGSGFYLKLTLTHSH